MSIEVVSGYHQPVSPEAAILRLQAEIPLEDLKTRKISETLIGMIREGMVQVWRDPGAGKHYYEPVKTLEPHERLYAEDLKKLTPERIEKDIFRIK